MTRPAQDFTDADLVAYLDGQAPEELHKEIDAALADDPSLAERLAGLSLPMDAVRGGWDALLDSAPPAPDLSPVATAPRPRRGLWAGGAFATGIAAGLAVAVFTGLGTAPPPPAPGWKAVVASYQSLYGPNTLTSAPAEAERTAQLAQASAALGLDITDLPQAQGLDFRRAQVLDFRGKTLVQIAYQSDAGAPVALCIIAAAGPAPKEMQAETLEGLAATSWNAGGFAYLLIGGEDPEALAPGTAAFEDWSRGA